MSSKTNRVGMVLDGPQIKAYYDDMPAHQSVKRGTIQVKRWHTDCIIKRSLYIRKLSSNRYNRKLSSNKISPKTTRLKIEISIYRYRNCRKNLIKYSNWLNQLFHGIEHRMQLEMLK